MFKAAEERGGVRQLELDFIEGNARARSLYEKLGFRITGVKPDAIRMKDGSFVNEYMMVKWL
jgi:ribosomal protein S18 acetylase RimI-like enzyme